MFVSLCCASFVRTVRSSTLYRSFVIRVVLGADRDSCLRRLLRFPPVEDVSVFVEMALRMKNHGPVVTHPVAVVKPAEDSGSVLDALQAAAHAAATAVIATASDVIGVREQCVASCLRLHHVNSLLLSVLVCVSARV